MPRSQNGRMSSLLDAGDDQQPPFQENEEKPETTTIMVDDEDEAKDPTLVRMDQLYRDLPEGWSKGGDPTKGEAPFVHVSGTVSWRHPNRKELDKVAATFMKEKEQQKEATQVVYSAQPVKNPMVKRLRLMLQSGLPLGAVEQRAKMEGIDMALILQETKEEEKESTTAPPVSPTLVRKYERMLKRGVPLPAVQQMAFVEGGWKPEQVEEYCKVAPVSHPQPTGAEALGTITYAAPKKTTPSDHHLQRKYERMARSGVPLAAIQETVQRDGVLDVAKVVDSVKGLVMQAKANMDNDEEAPSSPLFSLVSDKEAVSFQADTDLANLVRKLAQSIQKRATRGTTIDNNSADLVVSTETLYNALGSLSGVQVARDEYNSTINTNSSPALGEVQMKRQAFCEIARSIGRVLPMEQYEDTTMVDIAGLNELVYLVQDLFQHELRALKEEFDQGLYTFESLSSIYPPGSKVVAKDIAGGGIDMICRVAWNRYQQGKTIMGKQMKYFQVCLEYMVAVGSSHLAMAEVVEGIESFDGSRSMLSLSGDTLKFIPLLAYDKAEQEDLLKVFSRRGRMYNRVALSRNDRVGKQQQHAYMSYRRGSFFMKRSSNYQFGAGGGGGSNNAIRSLALGGRIIVDTQGAYDYGHSLSVGYDPMVLGIQYKYKQHKLSSRNQEYATVKGLKEPASSGEIHLQQVPPDFLAMTWPCVVGYSLTTQAWGDVLVDGLEDIDFQANTFDRLVLDEPRKKLIKALVRHTNAPSNQFQDLVAGKGEGTVFLLYGPPGVGKTLTAEAIAEYLHKPLFSLSMGTLGTCAADLESRLSEIMTLSSKWDALLLLDEADGLLESRSSVGGDSIERNAMVSVMLKLVEYFSGILFLTSNRIESLDPAFQTRITLALRYDALSVAGRAQIWENLLTQSGLDKFLSAQGGDIDVNVLASSAELNGREIKNALRLAMACAADEDKPLSQSFLLETVSIVSDYKCEAQISMSTGTAAIGRVMGKRALPTKKAQLGILALLLMVCFWFSLRSAHISLFTTDTSPPNCTDQSKAKGTPRWSRKKWNNARRFTE